MGRRAMLSGFNTHRAMSGVVLSLLWAAPVHGAGFGIFQQGAKAMGMAGAFTAQADDPSAMFHNVGGLAHQKKRAFQLGVTFITVSSSDFVGAAPGAAAGTRAESESLFKVPPHFYWVEPLGERWTFGLAVNSPFGLTSEWRGDEFAGRFLSRKASLETVDFNPNLAWKASDQLGVGFGLIARFSEVELIRNIPSFDPASGQVVDVAEITMTGDFESGYGYQVGLSSHPNNSWSWGLSYRSKIEIDYGGDGRFRQIPTSNPALDALIAATIPFGQDLPITTAIEFPDMASLGIAVRTSGQWLVELDLNWTGWSSLEAYEIDFTGLPVFSTVLPQSWEDAYNYRLGMSRAGARGSEWRFGVSFDETPQPLTTLDPILPDGDQSAVTVGYGFRSRSAMVDLALMYVEIGKRTTRVNINDYNGTYESTGLLFASTVSW
ncbi:MAG: hypothetical protein GY769_04025 [bacterium]|nr:hypothetical protein [bacterium]